MPPRSIAKPRTDADTFPLFVLVITLLIAGLPSLVIALVLTLLLREARAEDPRWRIGMLVLAAVGVAALYLMRARFADFAHQFTRMLQTHDWAALWPLERQLWLTTLPATPAVLLLLRLLRPVSTETTALRRDQRHAAADLNRQRGARRKVAKTPLVAGDALVIGAFVSGDLQGWQRGAWLTYPARELAQHAVLIGASGSGKTETLLRIAALAARTYNYQLVYIDAKGEWTTAGRFLAAMQAAGARAVPLFPVRAYAGWQGDGRALLNRLLSVQTFSEPYYADVAALVLGLAINAPGGAPRSSSALIERLALDRLRELYRDRPEASMVERLRAEDVRGVFQRYAGFFNAVGHQLDGTWTLGDVDAAYFLLDGTALKHEAASVGRFLLEDVAHYVTARKPDARKVLLVIDEFSAISGTADAANLFERIRAFGAAVIVSAQSYAGLGRDAEKLLGAATTLMVHACSDPERLTARAGTVRRVEYTYQTDERGTTGRTSLRPNDAPRIDPNTVRQQGVGDCVVIAHGTAARVQVARLPVDTTAAAALLRSGGWLPAGASMPAGQARAGTDVATQRLPRPAASQPARAQSLTSARLAPSRTADLAGAGSGLPNWEQPTLQLAPKAQPATAETSRDPAAISLRTPPEPADRADTPAAGTEPEQRTSF